MSLSELVMAALNKDRGYVVPPPLALHGDPDDLFMGAFRLHGLMGGYAYGLLRWDVRHSCVIFSPTLHGAMAPARVLAKAWHRLPAEHRWKLHYLIGADWSRQPYCFVAKRAINEADLLLLRTLLVEQMDRCWGMRLIELFCEDHAPSNTVSARFHSNPLAASILGELPIIRGQPFAP